MGCFGDVKHFHAPTAEVLKALWTDISK